MLLDSNPNWTFEQAHLVVSKSKISQKHKEALLSKFEERIVLKSQPDWKTEDNSKIPMTEHAHINFSDHRGNA